MPAESLKLIDLKGLVVCPGSIDTHSHSDLSVLFNPKAERIVMQGVTTVFGGNCGISLASTNPVRMEFLKRYISSLTPQEAELEWTSFKGLSRKTGKGRCACNIIPQLLVTEPYELPLCALKIALPKLKSLKR